jgi:capsid protein
MRPAVRIEADSVLHVFKPLAPGQLRGVSWVAPVILTCQ